MLSQADDRQEMIPGSVDDVKRLMLLTGGRIHEWTRPELEGVREVYEAAGMTLPDDVRALLEGGEAAPELRGRGGDEAGALVVPRELLLEARDMIRAGGIEGVADVLVLSHPDTDETLIRAAVALAHVEIENEPEKIQVRIGHNVGGHGDQIEEQFRYIVNDARAGIMRRTVTKITKKDGTIWEKGTGHDMIATFFLETAVLHLDPLNVADERYTLCFRDADRRDLAILYEEEPLKVILEDLPTRPGVSGRRLLSEAVTVILGELRRTDRIAVERRAPATGFFEDSDGALYFSQSRRFDETLPEFSSRRARDALRFLSRAMNFYAIDGDASTPENRDQYLTGLYFYVQAPLGSIRKQRGRENRILLLSGEPHVGKTHLEKIGAGIWGISRERGVIGASKLSIPQLAEHLDRTTFPIALDEVRNLLSNPAMADILKSSTTGMLIKERIHSHDGFRRQKFMAYASIVMSANYVPDLYLGLSDRLIPVSFTMRNKRPAEVVKLFETEMERAREDLPYIGAAIKHLLAAEWPRLRDAVTQDNQLEAGHQLLLELYRFLHVPAPAWLVSVETRYEVDEMDPIEEVCKFMAEDFLSRLQKGMPRDKISIDWDLRLEDIRANGLIPPYLTRISNENIAITKDVLGELQKKKGIEIAGGLIGILDRIRTSDLQRLKQPKLSNDNGRKTVYLDRQVFINYVETGPTDPEQ